MSSSITALLPRHYKIIDLFLDGQYKHSEIAEKVGVSPVTVKNVLSMPASQDIIARRRKNKEEVKDVVSARMELDQVEEARRALNDNARVAAEALIDGLFSEDDKVRTKSANDVLDRVGVSRVMRNESTNKSTVLIIDSVMAERIISTLDLDCD